MSDRPQHEVAHFFDSLHDDGSGAPLPGDPCPRLAEDTRPLATIRVEDDDSAHRLCLMADALGFKSRREYAVDPHQTDERRDAWVYARLGYRCRLNTAEVRVLPFLLCGDAPDTIAEVLGIQVHNVVAIAASVRAKTGAANHAQLLRLAAGVVAVDSKAGRRAVIMVIRAHPEWTLPQLFQYLTSQGTHAGLLGSLTIQELVAGADEPVELGRDGGLPIRRARLEQAPRLQGAAFDTCVREVLMEAFGPVAASYLRARVGGPPWKLNKSLRRLVAAGVVERTGVTSATVYAAARPRVELLRQVPSTR